jgi:hypothetical protein
MYVNLQDLGRDLWLPLLLTISWFLVNRRRSVLLPRYAAQKGFRFEESLDPSHLQMEGTEFLHNVITGTLDGIRFLYCEKKTKSEVTKRESLVAFELTSPHFAPVQPPMFGLLSRRTISHALFWWHRYLVPIQEMDAFISQGVRAFKAATGSAEAPESLTTGRKKIRRTTSVSKGSCI